MAVELQNYWQQSVSGSEGKRHSSERGYQKIRRDSTPSPHQKIGPSDLLHYVLFELHSTRRKFDVASKPSLTHLVMI